MSIHLIKTIVIFYAKAVPTVVMYTKLIICILFNAKQKETVTECTNKNIDLTSNYYNIIIHVISEMIKISYAK